MCCGALSLRKSVSRWVDKKSGFPQEEKGVGGFQGGARRRQRSGILKEEERTVFFPSTFLSLSHIKLFFFKPQTDDYTTDNSV